MLAVGGDAVVTHGLVVCGTAGAPVPTDPPRPDHQPAIDREMEALDRALDKAVELRGDTAQPLYVLWHYPPFDAHARPGPCVEQFERAASHGLRLRTHAHRGSMAACRPRDDPRGSLPLRRGRRHRLSPAYGSPLIVRHRAACPHESRRFGRQVSNSDRDGLVVDATSIELDPNTIALVPSPRKSPRASNRSARPVVPPTMTTTRQKSCRGEKGESPSVCWRRKRFERAAVHSCLRSVILGSRFYNRSLKRSDRGDTFCSVVIRVPSISD